MPLVFSQGKVLDILVSHKHNQNKSWGDTVLMDLFAELDQKLEAILSHFESLKQANAGLKETIAAKEQALAAKDKALKDAEAALEQITREKEMVRQRIDKILNRLKILELGEAT